MIARATLSFAAVAAAFTLGRRLGDTAGYHRAKCDHAGELVEAWEQGAQATRDIFNALGANQRSAMAHRVAQRRNAERGLQ